MLRPDHSRRPAFDAYKLITTHYAGTVSASEDRQSLYTVVTLNRGPLTTRVLWARTQAEATVSLPAQNTQARLIDQKGVEQIITPVDGQYTITLPGASCTAERPDCPVAHPTLMFRRERLCALGYRDTDGPEDYDLLLRLLAEEHDFTLDPAHELFERSSHE